MIKKLTCIVYPNGCEIEIDGDSIKGYTCKRGLEYAKEELFHPHRMVTSTVKIADSEEVCPVKTSLSIPKEEIFNVMKEINKICLKKPISFHQVVIKNVLNLGVDIITTKEFK